MSLITRCPSCGTMFKVVPDQLKVSEGWVRCGHCADVFDATANLQEDAESRFAEPDIDTAPHQTASSPVPSPPAPADDAGPDAGPESERESELESELEPEPSFDSEIHTEVGESELPVFARPSELDAQARELVEGPLDRPFELRREDDSELEIDTPPRVFIPADPAPGPESEPEPELHDLSFVRKARRQAFWRHPASRVLLVLAIVVLGTLLAVQVGHHDRDRLAALHPGLRPVLENVCTALGCTIGPPRQIDAVAIDTSSFNKLRSDAYRLNLTLRNQARYDIAMPALELTLTDANEQPVIRRVLQPSEFSSARSLLANAEWSTSIALAVPPTGPGARVAGYRLLAFYP